METMQRNLTSALKEYFGFNAFKDEQEAIINSILLGNDTFVIMPTGGGKSLCYQLPAMISEGTAIIISPLIALMKNQVDQMRGYSSSDQVAHFMNSSLSKVQIRSVKEDITSGITKMLYVAPETLVKDENIDFFKGIPISFVAVDEAHCISEWGHDFRPEYRRIRHMIDSIGQSSPIIALTATATPKVRADITKTLRMKDPEVFISSFLRDNLYYEVKPKAKKNVVLKDIIRFVKQHQGKSGIIYCLNRKTTEELAEFLNVNGVPAAPYHAGLDANTRARTQDHFLMEEIDVIVATIAFGMGIDKPDVRFVIHFNIPKSLENYYQETGRAGRDGLEGNCIAYYSYKDISKLEKFLRDKPVNEREIGHQHLLEVTAYSESAACRRKFLLHYFGEDYDTKRCGNGECDNCKYPRERIEVKDELIMAMNTVMAVEESHNIEHIVNVLTGQKSQEVLTYSHDKLPMFGKGKDRDDVFWNSLLRYAMLEEYLYKDIENYGIIKVGAEGIYYMKKPTSVTVPININYEALGAEADEEADVKGGALDTALLNMLKDLRKKIAREQNIPPFVIFQDPSLEDMATQYPITNDELANITGVSKGKAERYGAPFLKIIEKYVEENDIDRPSDFTMKSVASKSGNKISFIQNIDKKIPLEDIARSKSLTMDELLKELETIVASGTRLDIDYYVTDVLDEEITDIIYDYYRTAETDDLEVAFNELKDEGITLEEIQLIRIKFMSEMAN